MLLCITCKVNYIFILDPYANNYYGTNPMSFQNQPLLSNIPSMNQRFNNPSYPYMPNSSMGYTPQYVQPMMPNIQQGYYMDPKKSIIPSNLGNINNNQTPNTILTKNLNVNATSYQPKVINRII